MLRASVYLTASMMFSSLVSAAPTLIPGDLIPVDQYLSPVEIAAPIQQIFVPKGFDDNDNIEVILFGKFKNGCYRVGQTSANLDKKAKKIYVRATTLAYPIDTYCTQMIVPFIETVKVGVLKIDDPKANDVDYTVELSLDNTKTATLNVAKSKTAKPDNFVYAPVHGVGVKVDQGDKILNLRGRFPAMPKGRCAKIADVKTYVSPANVLVVLPIMEEITDAKKCVGYDPEYNLNFEIQDVFSGEGLVHVRTLNGQSFNQYVDLP